MRLGGLRIVVDCAHGAGYKVAPTVFWELGAEVFSLGVSPDGLNINRECGALAPEQMRREVLARRADIGIALDGDADRLIVADERGLILDGDQLMALIATGLVLFIMTLCVNLVARTVIYRAAVRQGTAA